MTDRGVVDPTRQGVATHEPEADAIVNAPEMTSDEALALVSSWGAEDVPRFALHRACEALAAALGKT